MKKLQMIVSAVMGLCLVVLTGCSHYTMRGTVAMKLNDNEAHVCMDDNEVKPGDRITLYRNACTRASRDSAPFCKKVELGKGTVTRNLNEHYSLVKFDNGVKFEEGSFVEKVQ